MRVRRQSNRQLVTLDIATHVGSGGEAYVYSIVGDGDSVAKLYHKPTKQRARKLEVMVANPPDDPMAARGHVSIAWPRDILLSVGGPERFVGFIMPRVSTLRPIIEFYNASIRRTRCPLFNYMYLLRAARNLAAAFRALHAGRYVVGDVNESNTLVASSALVTLLDTDSFQVRDPNSAAVYRCAVGRPEFTPPELQGKTFDRVDRTPEHDLFGLGVLVFQLLMGGQHPFNGVPRGSGDSKLEARITKGHFPHGIRRVPYSPSPGGPAFSTLSPQLQQLFVQCFEEGYRNPRKRPTAETWQGVLDDAEKSLLHCSRNGQHYYSDHLTSCPWCERATQLGVDAFPSRRAVQAGQHVRSFSQQLALPVTPQFAGARAPSPNIKPARPSRSGYIWLAIGSVIFVLFLINQSNTPSVNAPHAAPTPKSDITRSMPQTQAATPRLSSSGELPTNWDDLTRSLRERAQRESASITPRDPTSTPLPEELTAPPEPTLAPPAITYRVVNVQRDDHLNVRQGPGSDYPIVAYLPYDIGGIQLEERRYANGETIWQEISIAGYRGYVNEIYLQIDSSIGHGAQER